MLVFVAYVGTGLGGLQLPQVAEQVTLIWPPSGIALAAMLWWGPAVGVPVFAGAVAVNILIGGPALAAAGIGVGNTAGPLLAASFLRRRPERLGAGLHPTLTFLATVAAACVVPAAVGTLSLWATGGLSEALVWEAFVVWWAGDTLGGWLIGGTLLAVGRPRRRQHRARELLALAVAVAGTWGAIRLGGLAGLFLALVPMTLVGALFGRVLGSVALLGCLLVVAWVTAQGDGFLARYPLDETCLLMAVYAAAVGCIQQIVCASREELELRLAEADRARELLEARERYLHTVLENEPECVATLSADGILLDINAAGLRMLGVRAFDEVRGVELRSLVRPRHRAAFSAGIAAVFRGETNLQVFELVGVDGSHRWLEQHAAPIRDADGAVVQLLAVSRDITERVIADAERLRRQRMDAINSLAGGVAHDLNNVLTPVSLGLEELHETQELDPEMLQVMRAGLRHAAGILRQLLAFARGTQAERVSVDVRQLLGELTALLASAVGTQITIEVAAPGPLPPLDADETQLQQVLLNLCLNARDAMADGGVLRISASVRDVHEPHGPGAESAVPGRYLVFAVSDTGHGIPPDSLNKVFEPFFSTREARQGSGLGLSTVLGIVRGHGGFAQVSSAVGEGTTVTVFFPCAETPPPTTEGAPKSAEERGRTVLLVDDEPGVLQGTARLLSRYGFLVETAASGQDALARLHARRPDLVVTDLNMPGMDGIELIEAARALWPTQPFLLVTGRLDDAAAQRAQAIRSLDILQKPFTGQRLLRAIQRALSVSRSESPATGP